MFGPFCFDSFRIKPVLWGLGLWFLFSSTLGVWFFSFLLRELGCYLYTPCVLCVSFPSAFNIFALFN